MENTRKADALRLAAVGDVHCNRKTDGELQPIGGATRAPREDRI